MKVASSQTIFMRSAVLEILIFNQNNFNENMKIREAYILAL